MSSPQLLFTSGGTESNNLAVFGLAATRPGTVIVSSIEHPSVLAAAEYLKRQGREVRFLSCSRAGVVDLEQLKLALTHGSEPIACVSLMLANNETGVLQPIAEAAAMCHAQGIPIHCDAVQGLGKIPFDFDALQLDAMTVTSHKVHGPLGIGALVLKQGASLAPQQFGGFQQMGLRPGTEMPALAGGFSYAVELAAQELSSRESKMQILREELESRLKEAIPFAVVIGSASVRLPHTSCISFPGMDRQALHLALDQEGIACSTGSACASGSSQSSHVLTAMGLENEVIRGAVRFSLSFETTHAEIDQALQRIVTAVHRLARNRS
jgi:cysteine desulfurase